MTLIQESIEKEKQNYMIEAKDEINFLKEQLSLSEKLKRELEARFISLNE